MNGSERIFSAIPQKEPSFADLIGESTARRLALAWYSRALCRRRSNLPPFRR